MTQERIAELERDLAEALERQSAAAQVLEVLGRLAFELEPVFETVLAQAVRLCRADAGLIYVLDGDAYRVEVALGASQAYRDYISGVPIQAGRATLVGRVGAERGTVQILDAPADPRYTMSRALELGGFRTMLGVPMLASERVLGVIVLWRETVSPFDERTVELVDDVRRAGRDRDPERADRARARDRLRAQVGVPGLDVARAADAAERGHRVLRRAAGAACSGG